MNFKPFYKDIALDSNCEVMLALRNVDGKDNYVFDDPIRFESYSLQGGQLIKPINFFCSDDRICKIVAQADSQKIVIFTFDLGKREVIKNLIFDPDNTMSDYFQLVVNDP